MKESTRSWASFRIPGTSAQTKGEAPEENEGTAATQRDDSSTFIELGAVFEGTLTLSGDFRIDNEFRGELTTDGTVVVGPDGAVQGNINARQVEVEGAVVGNITARRMCIVRSSARVHGEIETACVEIERHAYFQGSTRMLHPFTGQAASDLPSPTV